MITITVLDTLVILASSTDGHVRTGQNGLGGSRHRRHPNFFPKIISINTAAGALGVGTGIALATGTTASADPSTDASTNTWDNALSAAILNPGAGWNWWFTWGDDRHVQIAGPNILAPQNGAKHTYFNFGKSLSGRWSPTIRPGS